MRSLIIVAIAIAIAIASPAFAIDRVASKSNSKSAAIAGAVSGAVSSSTSQGGAGGGGGSSSLVFNAAPAGASQSITYDFSSQVPDVYAPALAGGGACTESASAGTSHPGFGFSFGLSWEGENCAVRNEVMVLHNTQQIEEAKVHGCLHLERVKATYELMGKDCLGNPLEGK